MRGISCCSSAESCYPGSAGGGRDQSQPRINSPTNRPATMNDKKLEVFQELNLRARTDRSTIRAAILAHLPPEWSHDQKREDEVKVNGVSAEEVIVLQRSAAGAIPGARVFLWGETNGYRISNIVPIEVNELGISLYNQVLRDLVEQVARPASKAGGFDMIVSDDLQTIEDWLDPEAA